MYRPRKDLIENIKLLDERREFTKNLKQIQEYLRYQPDDQFVRIYEARTLMKLGKLNDARNILEDVIEVGEKDRDILSALNCLGEVELRAGNYERAIELFKTYMKNSKTNLCITTRCMMSQAYLRLGNFDAALNILYIEGINNLELKTARAHVYFASHQYEKCLETLDEEETLNSFSRKSAIDKYCLKANVYLKIKDYDKAIELFNKAMEKSGEESRKRYEIMNTLATIYLVKGEKRKAIEECEFIIKNCRNKKVLSETNYTLGLIYLYIHDEDNAYKYFSQCNDNERNIGYAKIAYYKGNFEEALKILSNIPETDAYIYRDIHILIAQIMFRLKKYEDFKKEYYNVSDATAFISNRAANKDIYNIEYIRVFIEKHENIKLYGKHPHVSEYTYLQLTSYDPALAIKHIKEGHTDESLNDVCFNSDIDMEALYEFVRNNLDESTKKYESMKDVYLVDLKSLGCPYSDDLIEVICICDTFDIMTMYPVNYREHYENLKEAKVRKKSAIDKFNKRYGL